jgi:hypothetical protein
MNENQNNQNFDTNYTEYQNVQPISTNIPQTQIPANQQKPVKIVVKTKSFRIDWHWVLTIFLIFYSMFSFIWLTTLYSGDNGVKICASSNFLCDISFPYTKQAIIAVNESQQLTKIAKTQKDAKNFVRNTWLQQVSANEDLTLREQDLEKSILEYKNYLQNYIRFLNGESQLLNGFDQTEYTNRLSTLEEEIQNLRLKRNEAADKKIENKKQIDQLYIDLNEKQENSFKQTR